MTGSYKNSSLLFLFVSLLVLPVTSFAQEANNLASMFENFSTTYEDLLLLAQGFARVAGVAVSISAVLDLIKHNDGKVELKQPITKMVIGAMLFSASSTLTSVSSTFGFCEAAASCNFFTGLEDGETGKTPELVLGAALKGIMGFIILVGHLSFVKGLFLLKDYGSGKQDTLGRGFTHIIGGALAVNIQATAGMLRATFWGSLPTPGALQGL